MCMSAALMHPEHGCLVATDTRFTWPNGTWRDLAGRIRQMPGGFAVATGQAHLVLLALANLTSVRAEDRDGVLAVLQAAHGAVCGRLRARESREPGDLLSAVLVAGWGDAGPLIYSCVTSGEMKVSAGDRAAQLVAWAPGLPASVRAQGEATLRRRLKAARSVHDLVRAAGFIFHAVHQRSTSISGTVELGIVTAAGPADLSAPAARVWNATDEELDQLVEDTTITPATKAEHTFFNGGITCRSAGQ